MLWGEYRHIDILKENLKYKQEWLRRAYWYMRYSQVENRAEAEFFKQRPLIYSIVFFINLPLNIIDFFKKLKWNYQFDKICKEAEFLKKEINKFENKTKLLD